MVIGCCTYDGRVRFYEASDPLNLTTFALTTDIVISTQFKESQSHAYKLSFCACEMLPKMFIVSCPKEKSAKIYKFENKWNVFETIKLNDSITDLSWSSSLGKYVQLIAISLTDSIKIYKMDKGKVALTFEAKHSGVCSIEWNITGTILSSVAHDGSVKLWKSALTDEWKCFNEIEVETDQKKMSVLT